MKPYRLIAISGYLYLLDYSYEQPQGSFLLHENVTGEDGLLLPEFRNRPLWKGKTLRGGQ